MYDVKLKMGASDLRIFSDGELLEVRYNGALVTESAVQSAMGLGSFAFEVDEDGERVVYDVAVVRGEAPSCFVGRNGELVFSDAPGFETGRASDD